MALPLQCESIWIDKYKFDDAEKHWQESLCRKQDVVVADTNVVVPMKYETIWFDKFKFDDAEKHWQEYIKKENDANEPPMKRSLIDEIEHARQQIKKSLQSGDFSHVPSLSNTSDLHSHFHKLKSEVDKINTLVKDVLSMVTKLEGRISVLEGQHSHM